MTYSDISKDSSFGEEPKSNFATRSYQRMKYRVKKLLELAYADKEKILKKDLIK